MKKIAAILLGISFIFSNFFSDVYALQISTEQIETYNEFIDASDKKVYLDDKDVTEEFLLRTEEFFKIKDYVSIYEIQKEGYILHYSVDVPTTRAFEQKIKKYNYSGLSTNGGISCDWKVSFTCKYSVNVNTGKIGTVSDPILKLEYGVVTNLTGTVILDNQSAYVSYIGNDYVKFGYRFTIMARVNTGLGDKTVNFTTRSGTETL